MDTTKGDMDQFQVLEEKIEGLIEKIRTLKKEKESLSENAQIQEERLADQNEQILRLKESRDGAKQRIVSLLEKIEQVDI
jgi:FtsZ-binding cell division protein ZapB